MRIVVGCIGSRGDVEPCLTLARGLRDRGHDVVASLSGGFEDRARAAGVAYRPTAHRPKLDREKLKGGWSPLRDGFFPRSLLGLVDDLIDHIRHLCELCRDADLLVSGGPWIVAYTAADASKIAYVRLTFSPAMLPSADHPPPDFPAAAPPLVARLLWEAVQRGRGIAFRPGFGPLNAERRALGLPPVTDVSEPYHRQDVQRMLLADPLLLPLPADVPGRWAQPGALAPVADDTPLPAPLRAFLGAGPPPIYVGFGSMRHVDPAAFTALAEDAARRAGCRLLLGAGWAGIGRDGVTSETVMTVGDVVHTALFPHCAGIVHHGGAGTLSTAAAAGVPQLLVPHRGDQFHHARRVVALGIGPPSLSLRKLDAASLADRFRRLLDDEPMRERARGIGRIVRERDSVGAAVALIEAHAARWRPPA